MISTETLTLQTKGDGDIIDITERIAEMIAHAVVKNETVTLFVNGSTAGLTTIEYEPGVISDFNEMWQRIIPRDMPYEHDRAWGDGNGHSHVRASLLGASLVVPFSDKRLALGTWQQIILVDCDNRARSRRVVVQVIGEK